MDYAEEIKVAQIASDYLFACHRGSDDLDKTLQYKLETNYDYITAICAGFTNQIEKKGVIYRLDILPELQDYKFISPEIVTRYFKEPIGIEFFISHLFVEQKKLELCLLSAGIAVSE